VCAAAAAPPALVTPRNPLLCCEPSEALSHIPQEHRLAGWARGLPAQLELAIVDYLGWFNNARLHESLGDIRPPNASSSTSSSVPSLSLIYIGADCRGY
jgi:transposase InsO family protein